MKRRELIKGLAAFGALAILPNTSVLRNRETSKLHFIGLGFAGRNVLTHIYQKGIRAEYTYMCYRQFPDLNNHLNYIYYEYPRHIRQSNELGKQSMPLTDEMKRILSDDRIYIVVVGLGAYSGTSLISDTLEFLESNNKRYLAICTLPFKNEGQNRNEYAMRKKTDLRKYGNVRFFDNNEILKKYGQSRISKDFEHSDEEIYRIFEEEFPKLIS